MALSEYFRILRRWGWLFLLTVPLTVAAAYVFSKVQTPIYRSTAFVSVQPARPDFGLTQSAKTLLRSYVLVIDTETFAQKVIDRLQLDMLASELKGNVTIASDESRLAIQIDVKHTDGNVANDIARAWADEFRAWRDVQNAAARREDKVDAILVDDPRYAQFRPNTRANLLAGAILGGMLGAVAIFLVEYVQSGVIRSSADVERMLDLSVLGTIPPGEPAAPPANGPPHACQRSPGHPL